jgi:peptidoglycan/xylan/chitin deacetylase (PgdA/CDA1 family)
MRLFKEYGIKCTSWMVGQALVLNPDVGRALVRDGHEVARCVATGVCTWHRVTDDRALTFRSHGWRWVDRSVWTPEEETENVIKTIDGESDEVCPCRCNRAVLCAYTQPSAT